MAGNFWASSHRSKWLLDPGAISKSQKADLKFLSETELKRLRMYYSMSLCHGVQQLAKRLSLRYKVASTAIVYFRRFYASDNNFSEFDPALVGATCVFLASKVEECPLRPDAVAQEMKAMKDLFVNIYSHLEIISCEYHLLESLQCHLLVFHPYRSLQQYLQSCELDRMDSALETTWKYINDAYLTDVLLIYPPHLITLACIYMTSFMVDKDVSKWFEDLNVSLNDILEITKEIFIVYELSGSTFETECRKLIERIPRPSSTVAKKK